MKILPAIPLAQPQSGQAQFLSLADGGAWADTLTMGQILKARVLRQLSEGRYQLDFAGQTRVVDSAIPLSVGDVLHGKVVGLSGQVMLERVQVPRDIHAAGIPRDGEHSGAVARHPPAADGVLNATERAALARISRSLADPALADRIGRFLVRLGLPLSADLVRVLYDAVSPALRSAQAVATPELAQVPRLQSLHEALLPAEGDVAAELADLWFRSGRDIDDDAPTDDAAADPAEGDASDGESAERAPADLIRQLLNIRTGAAFQHRFQTLPVVIDGRLIEFDLALFDHQAPDEKSATRSRRIRMDLQTTLGVVQLDARVTGERVRMAITAENEAFALALSSFRPELEHDLDSAGWALEQADYLAGPVVDAGAADAVIAHVLAQDSLRMVI